MVWYLLGLAGFLGYIPGLPPELRLLNLFFLVPFASALVRRLFTSRKTEKIEQRPRREEPLPPAAGGAARMTLRYITSTILCFIVPTMLVQIIRQMVGQSLAQARAIDAPEQYQQKVRYRLPFTGMWYVVNGGVNRETSHSWDIVGQRYAYDFVMTDETLRRWRTDGKQLADYLCYDQPILAPAAGEIVAIVDGVRDAPGVGTGWLDVFTRHFPGNGVVIRHAEGEYSLLAHLVPGSIPVHVGQRVEPGQLIGRCGNSGHSSEPHLHFQVQDHPDFFRCTGLPVAFDHVSVDGSQAQDGVYLERGTHVRHSVEGSAPSTPDMD